MTDLSKFLGEDTPAVATQLPFPEVIVNAVLPCQEVSQGAWPDRAYPTYHNVQFRFLFPDFPATRALELAVITRVRPGTWPLEVGIVPYGNEASPLAVASLSVSVREETVYTSLVRLEGVRFEKPGAYVCLVLDKDGKPLYNCFLDVGRAKSNA